jgi:hypothetical protein
MVQHFATLEDLRFDHHKKHARAVLLTTLAVQVHAVLLTSFRSHAKGANIA